MTDERAVRWIVSGRVQGVGYRWFTRRHASRLGLRGWAANLPDGRVEVVARGEPVAIETLSGLLRSGPAGARVDSVESTEISHDTVMDKPFYTK